MVEVARNNEVPGNAMASAAAVTRQLVGIGERLMRVETMLDKAWDDGVVVERINILVRGEQRGDNLVVVSGLLDGRPVVAFHGGDTFTEALMGALARIENRSLKWRDDEYRKDG